MICTACNVEHDLMTDRQLGMVCGRCNTHTGNYTQGHYWGLCKVLLSRGVAWKEAIRELHFCCPDDCSLEATDEPCDPCAEGARCDRCDDRMCATFGPEPRACGTTCADCPCDCQGCMDVRNDDRMELLCQIERESA